ncbi:MAG: hypothetical protein K0S33_2844 [Bacteroidetes bacterium]|jgi:uncharacterized protein YciI|nr:hypothetical protein [Bacteroidota bacterium]
MNKILLIVFLFAGSFCLQAQKENPKYNKALADSMGADVYGMKNYVFVILKSGPVKISDKAKNDSLFAGHMANIERLAKKGILTVAGPMGKNDKGYRGIFIFNVKTVEEAVKLLDTDPTIKAKVLEAECYPWYGSAALPLYLPYHDEVKKKDF